MARGVKSKLFWYELSEPTNDIESTQVAMLLELDEANVHATNAGKVKPLTDLTNFKLIPAGLRVRKNENKYGIQPRMVELQVVGSLTGTTCYIAPKFRKIRYPILTVAQWAAISVAFKNLDTSLPPANYPAVLKFAINHSADGTVDVDYIVSGLDQQVMTPGRLD